MGPTDGCTLETWTASDGYRWRYRRYGVAGTPKGRVVALHGIQSHGGWYTASCRYLAEAGYAVDFLDRRGSGLNEEARGDAPGFRRLLADIAEFLRAGSPAFLAGISWGGKLAVALEQFHPGLTAGLLLLTPGLCPRIRPPGRQRLAIVWSRLVSPRRLFPIPLDDPELFTANPVRQAFIRDDPLSLRQATARFLVSSIHLDIVLRRAPLRIGLPVLLLLAGRDRIIDNARTRAYLERFATSDRQVIEYPKAHHTLEFEPDPTPVFADVLAWLERHRQAVRGNAASSSGG
jgi:alpha-beta hydrolase superfamily lysophospholipase